MLALRRSWLERNGLAARREQLRHTHGAANMLGHWQNTVVLFTLRNRAETKHTGSLVGEKLFGGAALGFVRGVHKGRITRVGGYQEASINRRRLCTEDMLLYCRTAKDVVTILG